MPVSPRTTLSPSDLAWLRVATPEHPSVTTVVLVCERTPDEACLKARIEERLLGEPRFRQRIEWPHLAWARPRWVEHDDLRLDEHFICLDSPTAGSSDHLPTLVSALRAHPLDESLPLWQVHFARFEKGRSATVLRLHEAVADSRAALDLAVRLTDYDSSRTEGTSPSDLQRLVSPEQILRQTTDSASRIQVLSDLIVSRSDRDNPFRCSPTGSRPVAWSDPIASSQLQRTARVHDASTIEILVNGIVGALRSALHRQDIPAEDVHLRAVVPISLRQPVDALNGTRLALGQLSLPLQASTFAERLTEVRRSIEKLQQQAGGLAILAPDSRQSLSMTDLEERFLRLLGKKVTALLSFADAPAQKVRLCDMPVTDILWWPGEIPDLALGIAAISYAGHVGFTVAADAGLGLDPSELAGEMIAACNVS